MIRIRFFRAGRIFFREHFGLHGMSFVAPRHQATLKTTGPSKTYPCVRSKRPRVCRHHTHMLKHMCAWCWHTRGRFERTHGVFSVSHHTHTPHHTAHTTTQDTTHKTQDTRPTTHQNNNNNNNNHNNTRREREEKMKDEEKMKKKMKDKTREDETEDERGEQKIKRSREDEEEDR